MRGGKLILLILVSGLAVWMGANKERNMKINYKHEKGYLTQKQHNLRQEELRRMEKRASSISRRQARIEKQCYADYVFWKMQLEKTMNRLGMFIFR